jgi:hypothetical protein
MQLALEALEDANDVARMEFSDEDYYSEAINALRQALEEKQKTAVSPGKGTGFNYARSLGITVLRQPQEQVGRREPEPTAWQCQCGKAYTVTCISSKPSKREWVGLTDEEIQDLSYLSQKIDEGNAAWFDRWGFARAIEAKLKEKNKW